VAWNGRAHRSGFPRLRHNARPSSRSGDNSPGDALKRGIFADSQIMSGKTAEYLAEFSRE
jgi:hypothetical protein